jgi:hypothetical protein
MSNEIIINGQKVKIIEWQSQRVITTREISTHHNLETKIINEKFRRNKKHFKENIDYFIVTKQEVMKDANIDLQYLFTSNDELYLFTLAGYFNFIKTINDDRAWEIFEELKQAYFNIQKLNNIETVYLQKSKEHRKGLASEWSKHNARNYAGLTVTEYESLFNDIKIRKKQMDDKQLSLLSAFEFLESRKLENNPELKGDYDLSESLKDTGKKIITIIKPKKELKV